MWQGILTPGDVDIGWRTVWQEARDQGFAGMLAVAWTLRNRLEFKAGDARATLAQTCLEWMQFSGWREQDPNFKPAHIADLDATGRECLRAVLTAFDGGAADDPTHGARHYYSPRAMVPAGAVPLWARGKLPAAKIGDQLFFNDVA